MARVRLFASVAEAAGQREADIDAPTVAAVLDVCGRRFGDAFSKQLPHCSIWVNGERRPPDTEVGPDDEVAVLPPVSGGAQR